MKIKKGLGTAVGAVPNGAIFEAHLGKHAYQKRCLRLRKNYRIKFLSFITIELNTFLLPRHTAYFKPTKGTDLEYSPLLFEETVLQVLRLQLCGQTSGLASACAG